MPRRPSGVRRGDAGGDEAIGGDCGSSRVSLRKLSVTACGGCWVGARLDGDGGERAAEEARAEGTGFFGDEVAQGGHAFVHGAGGNGVLAVEFPGGRAGARGERKEVEVGEGLRGDEAVALVGRARRFRRGSRS